MKALVVEGMKTLTYKTIEKPKLSDNEVLIRIRACGICGSDVARAKDGGVHRYPIVIGHEFSGDIAEVGAKVTGCAAGDRVTAAPLVPCGVCENCQRGKPAMCTQYSFIGSRQNGAMAEYVAVPARNVIPIVDGVSYEQAACIEPITVALHGVERANILSGKSAIVYGCGTIGNLVLQCLKAKGVEKIYAIDIDTFKLDVAKKHGAYETIHPLKTNVQEYFEKNGKVDYIFEA